MSGEPIRDLHTLLAQISPALDPREYVFVTSTAPHDAAAQVARLTFHEDEGVTYVLERARAETLGLAYAFPCKQITLQVTSALDAIGFVAAVATTLARNGIASNVVSAYHHDHLFVPAERADEALAILREPITSKE